jgi:hypothetical protein
MDMARSEESEKKARNTKEKEIAQDMRRIYPVIGPASTAPHRAALLLALVPFILTSGGHFIPLEDRLLTGTLTLA